MGLLFRVSTVIQQFLWSWGDNVNGRLALGDTLNRSSPTQVGSLSTWNIISDGNDFGLAIKTDGTLWAWGNSNFGQLGLNNLTEIHSPVQVGSLTVWADVSASKDGLFTVAVKTDGTMWSWGRNDQGQLGLGDADHLDTKNRSSPTQIGSATNWSSIFTGLYHVAAVKTDGTLWAWGHNAYGQLGKNDVTFRSSPVQIGLQTTWSKVVSGSLHTLAIKTDGTLWSFGLNSNGQIGVGALGVNKSSPVQVGLLTTWVSIGACTQNSAAIRTDGTLWTWGLNTSGESGLGDVIHRSAPVQVGILTDWSKVANGNAHMLAIKTDGTLWVWGRNDQTQLGLNLPTTEHRSSPVQVGSLTSWSKVSAGNYSSFAIKG